MFSLQTLSPRTEMSFVSIVRVQCSANSDKGCFSPEAPWAYTYSSVCNNKTWEGVARIYWQRDPRNTNALRYAIELGSVCYTGDATKKRERIWRTTAVCSPFLTLFSASLYIDQPQPIA